MTTLLSRHLAFLDIIDGDCEKQQTPEIAKKNLLSLLLQIVVFDTILAYLIPFRDFFDFFSSHTQCCQEHVLFIGYRDINGA